MTIRRRLRWGGAAGLALALCFTAFLAAEDRPPAREGAEDALPADLAKVPGDAAFIASVRLGDLWDNKVGQAVRRAVPGETKEFVREFREDFGLEPGEVERYSLVHVEAGDRRPDPLAFVRAREARQADKLLAAGKDKVSRQRRNGQTFYQAGDRWALWPLDDRSFVYGSPEAVRGLIDRPAPKKEGRLTPALRLAAGRHTAVCGLNVKAFNDALGVKLPAEVEPFKPLLEASWAAVVADVGEEIRAEATLTFATEKAAGEALKPGQAALDLARDALRQSLAQQGKRKEMAHVRAVLQLLQEALQTAQVGQDGKTLRASIRVKVDAARLSTIAAEVVREVREENARIQVAANLHQLGVALHDYHDTYGHFPLRANFDKNGKPLLSWRVQLLPFIGERELFKQFRQDEPWDSEHNKKLLARMPNVYASPQDEKTRTEHTTHLQVFVGTGTVFDGKKRIGMAEITRGDGTSNTLFLAEAAKAVPWTRPEDLPFEPGKPLPRLGLPGADGFHALFCDGHVNYIRHTIKPKVLECLITWNDGTEIKPGDIEGNE